MLKNALFFEKDVKIAAALEDPPLPSLCWPSSPAPHTATYYYDCLDARVSSANAFN